MPTLIECADAEENVRLCRQLGLQFVELNMNLPMYQAEYLNGLKDLSDRYGVGFTIHLDENFNAADFNPLIREAWLSTFRQAIAAAKVLSAAILNLHLTRGVYFTLPDRRVYLFEKYVDEYMRHMRAMCDLCERELAGTDIRICVENTDGFLDYQRRAIDMLLESRCFGLTWDIGHSHAANCADEAFILDRRSCLRHFHVHDALGSSCHLELGTGEIDIDERLSLAAECGAACVLETKTASALEASVRRLRKYGWIE